MKKLLSSLSFLAVLFSIGSCEVVSSSVESSSESSSLISSESSVSVSSNVETSSSENSSSIPLSAVDQQIQDVLDAFLANYAADYVNESKIDSHVASALAHLGVLENYVSEAELATLLTQETLNAAESVGDLFKYSVTLAAFGQNIRTYQGVNLLEKLVTLNPSGAWVSPNAIMALNHDQETPITGQEAYVTTLLQDMTTTNTPLSYGVDFGGTTLIALAPYYGQAEVKTVVDEYVNWIATTEQHANGAVADAWSGENASTIAQVILGFVANKVDPRGEQFTKEGNDLVTALLTYAQEDGSFKWKLEDETSDLAFSTQQAILALAVYQEFARESHAVNAYLFQ